MQQQNGTMRLYMTLCVLAAGISSAAATQAKWAERFAFQPPAHGTSGVCHGTGGTLPTFDVQVAEAGLRTVRVSLFFKPGTFPENLSLRASCGDAQAIPDIRILTRHPGKPASVRRALITFPFDFKEAAPHQFLLALADEPQPDTPGIELDERGEAHVALGPWTLTLAADRVTLKSDLAVWEGALIAPARTKPEPPIVERIEYGRYHAWVRLLEPDATWPRIVEARMDASGAVTVQVHLQRMESGDGTAPDLGWMVRGPVVPPDRPHRFGDGQPIVACSSDGAWTLSFPDAASYRRGRVEAEAGAVRYLRCASEERVPMQESAWRRAAFAIAPASVKFNALLEPVADIRMTVSPLDLAPWPLLDSLRAYTHRAIVHCMCQGDDFGNVTAYNKDKPAPAFGMNRLNHAWAIFDEAGNTGDRTLRDTLVLWCSNMYDLSLWWGDTDTFGGTRYNNANAMGVKDHLDDKEFMWRSNTAVHFCTKGINAFFHAYEETGDPRFTAALRAQMAYAKEFVHADRGECRNIGDVADFMDLYRCTGDEAFRGEALRLFRELRTKLGEDSLFSQGGQPIVSDGPFIDDDQHGYEAPFAKPYIIGYALAGLPDLLRECPDEPRLRDVVRAVADFLASSQDPTGGWRYPHPRSSRTLIEQGMEHAAQLSRAARVLEERGEPIGNLLDAIERTLQARVNGYARSGTILSGLQGWESNPGNLKEGQTIYDLYKKPADRDPARDYTEGAVSVGSASPEGLVYFSEVLAFYLAHRPADRLFWTNDELKAVLDRVEAHPPEGWPPPPPADPPAAFGVRKDLPAFRDAQLERLTFPLAWKNAGLPFGEWRERAREVYRSHLGPRPPLAPFMPTVLAREDRGAYEARKIALNLSADTRVVGYLLVPKGMGPFPAVLGLHDHGAHFSIGKEKVIRPFDVPEERLNDAMEWVKTCYGGRFFGDELARRGYVVFATDMLFWGDRGRQEGVKYEAQERLAANMFHLGVSWAGRIVWDDLRCAEFLQSLPEVDPERIGCAGLSVGSHRAWSLNALTDIVKAGLAICWMCDTKTLMQDGNNQTTGQSAFSMILPGLRNHLDYPDVASIACPKPMLFYNGEKDGLFPVSGVEACHEKLRDVWRAQGAEGKLETRLWPVPHEFNADMQEAAFAWLDRWLAP
ncbi:MAG TPA: alpha/beta hydrolase family protein [Candidatus Hydrogenedentes bacterium]|nr:alpha/beta hydrolase family protein [Candidatus Hydrogenedentota bacterium]HRT20658.1 alpha/beta hydrolase family protein [Candidatus Hydrogenedentota bacterium]HRT65693.1 alpha/beta hydrolase family protein [Candidatus Hydrogenedentota bacterium]